ncbi:putative TonB-dependent receptor [uncultured Woeseiaceae bacterium]|uniref:Putative TonB-dependent receptor n=1 Tax=uncultured Woeseiaceae bacterium TaxID=1983305 RepID=A0A7D9H629_9GAMM|nr:putative TonB-dependent receptor [uncultured Woeseiaceae bacterium]
MSRFTLGTVGIAAVFLAGTFGAPTSVQAQESDAAIEEIVVTGIGSRASQRSSTDLAVPVDVLSLDELNSTNQMDIGQMLQFTAPSFNAVKFGINDLSPLTDPASLRGLSPDQTLLLVNGKRRHKVAFFNLNHGLAKGQLGNDINAIPAAAIKQVEILRDGAAAQYGSDAIAGVVNLVLNDASSGGSIRAYSGVAYSQPEYDGISPLGADGAQIYPGNELTDGATYSVSANFGLPWGEEGFINTTLWAHHNDAYDRSGVYTHSEGWYPDDPLLSDAENAAEDERLRTLNGIDLDRAILGAAENTNSGIFINAGRPMDENWDFYVFGGFSDKEVIGGIFSRAAARDDRNNLNIFPNGFNPITPAKMKDYQIVTGARGDLAQDWTLDFSMGYSGNELDLFNTNTINPSMGDLSPTEFYTGSLEVTQYLFNVDATKVLGDGNTILAFGTEVRFETFAQKMGQGESWRIGEIDDGSKDVGSTGREGFSDITQGEWERNNVGLYAEVEREFTDAFLATVAVRWENYSDFGDDFSYKLAARYRFSPRFTLRGSVNRSFRAISLAQYQYSNYVQIAFDDAGDSVVTPFLPTRSPLVQQAFGITELEPETSLDFALGITSELTDNLSLTLDVYQIEIEDRIIISGGINAADFPVFDGSGYDEVNIFTNAIDTTTEGIDVVINYVTEFGNDSQLSLALAANFNDTEVDKVHALPGLDPDDLIDERDLVYITDGAPSQKVIVTAIYQWRSMDLLARVTNFGEVKDARTVDPSGNPQTFSSQAVTDLSFTGHVTDQLSITAGVNNVFDVYPDMLYNPAVRGEVIYSRRTNQFGTMGRFLNLSMQYNW